ncbi:hypothetical protein ACQEWB_04780 [Streptomyces sp. CA-249302]|uniref:hypothetical protein n=1 Tax=Streptomyces sp. CA-249302 TaxID=3240058 RepID=UPI003D92D76A
MYGHRGEERSAFVRACADGARPEGIPEAAADLTARHARTAAAMDEFSRRFQEESGLAAPPYKLWDYDSCGHGAGMPASR